MNVKDKFDQAAPSYDRLRTKLIPCFQDFYEQSMSLAKLTLPKKESYSVLDLGAGTGLMSEFIVDGLKVDLLTLADLSEDMLAKARDRFQNRDVNYWVGDYRQIDVDQKYDLVISGLSIHHLNHQDKEDLYKRVPELLNPGGIFINADQVLGHSDQVDQLYKTDWKNKIESTDLTKDQLDQAYERTKLDQMSTLDDQLAWLRKAEFTEVDCVYKYYNFVILWAKK